MKEFKLTVRTTTHIRGIWHYGSYAKALSEKKKWEAEGYICTIEEVET